MSEKTYSSGFVRFLLIVIAVLGAGCAGLFVFAHIQYKHCQDLTTEQSRLKNEAATSAAKLDAVIDSINKCKDALQGNLSGVSDNNQSDAERLESLASLLGQLQSALQNAGLLDNRPGSGSVSNDSNNNSVSKK